MRTPPAPRLALLVLLLPLFASCDTTDEEEQPLRGKLVFSSRRGGQYALYTMNADGSGLKQITTGTPEEGGDYAPAWSPDGRRIAFHSSREATTLGASLFLVNADGTDMRPLKRYATESPTVLVGWDPVWSPDGSRIAYEVCTNCEIGGRNYEITVVKVEGEAYDPRDGYAVTSHPASDTDPTWSPDGKRIAFVSNRDYDLADSARYRTDLYVANADGSSPRRLTDIGNVRRPIWSPDGSTIVCGLINDARLLLINPASGEKSFARVKGVSPPWGIVPEAWSPEGRELLITGTGQHIWDVVAGEVERVPLDPQVEPITEIDWYVEPRNGR